jgi:hypothetical protein
MERGTMRKSISLITRALGELTEHTHTNTQKSISLSPSARPSRFFFLSPLLFQFHSRLDKRHFGTDASYTIFASSPIPHSSLSCTTSIFQPLFFSPPLSTHSPSLPVLSLSLSHPLWSRQKRTWSSFCQASLYRVPVRINHANFFKEKGDLKQDRER